MNNSSYPDSVKKSEKVLRWTSEGEISVENYIDQLGKEFTLNRWKNWIHCLDYKIIDERIDYLRLLIESFRKFNFSSHVRPNVLLAIEIEQFCMDLDIPVNEFFGQEM